MYILQVPFLSLSSYSDILLIAEISGLEFHPGVKHNLPLCRHVYVCFMVLSDTDLPQWGREKSFPYLNILLSVSLNPERWIDLVCEEFLPIWCLSQDSTNMNHTSRETLACVTLCLDSFFKTSINEDHLFGGHRKHEDSELCQQCGQFMELPGGVCGCVGFAWWILFELYALLYKFCFLLFIKHAM